MDHRTQLSQEDEALRQTRADDTIRQGLRWIADRLTNLRPSDEMTPNARQTLAMRYALDTYGDTGTGGALCAMLLKRMPTVDRDLSRGEYALIIRPTVQGAQA